MEIMVHTPQIHVQSMCLLMTILSSYQYFQPAMTPPRILQRSWLRQQQNVLSIGASTTNLSGNVANFSSQGPSLDGRVKPDLVAPGVLFVQVELRKQQYQLEVVVVLEHMVMETTCICRCQVQVKRLPLQVVRFSH